MMADILESPEARRSVFPVSVEFYDKAASSLRLADHPA